MGNAAGSMEMSQGKEATPGSSGSQKRTKELKLPMPPDEELEQRFNAVLVSQCTRQTAVRNKEFGICRKCARPHEKLIAAPGTQCHRGKIHKRSFMLELTAALGSLHGLLEEG